MEYAGIRMLLSTESRVPPVDEAGSKGGIDQLFAWILVITVEREPYFAQAMEMAANARGSDKVAIEMATDIKKVIRPSLIVRELTGRIPATVDPNH